MPRQVMIAVCVLAVAATSNSNSFGLVFARAAEGLGLSVAALVGLRTIENAVAILVALAVAPLVDRVPRKYMLMTGLGLATSAVLTLVSLDSRLGAILYFALNGAATMLIFGALTATPSDFVSGRTLNRTMGIVIGCIAFTAILVAPVVGNVADSHGWRAGMLVSSGVTILAFTVTLLLIPRYRVSSVQSAGHDFLGRYRAIAGERALLLMLSSNMLRFAMLASMLTFLSTVFIQRYGLSLSRIGLIFAATGVIWFLASTSSGFILHLLQTRRLLVWGGVITIFLLIAALVVGLSLPLMVGAVLMFIAILAAQENTGTIAVLRLSPDARGAAMSWNELAAGIGSFLGIGTGSIGMALGGISGLGIALVVIAVMGTLLSRVALAVSSHLDEEDQGEPITVPA